MKNFLFTLLVTVALLLGSNTTISAQPTPVAPAEGSGTAADPYLITTFANLYWITASDVEVPSPTRATRWTKYYVQTANIDFTAPSWWNWPPIGNAELGFTGNYNGNFNTINRLKLLWPTDDDYLGLFGAIDEGAVISNVGLTNVYIVGNDNVGGLVGCIRNGTITNSYTTGFVKATTNVGGMVGLMESGTITNAYSAARITGDWNNIPLNVGGMVGKMESGTITNAYAIGYIYGVDVAGGLVGWNSTGNFNNCFWDKDLSGQSSSHGGTDKTAFEMRTQSTFTGWDFTPGPGKWQMASTGSGYRYCPVLQLFTYDVPFTTPEVNPVPGLVWAYSGGDGTAGSPFQIANLTDLRYLSSQFYDWSSYFIQTENIDATLTSSWTYSFQPIGSFTTEFIGNFNGNGHTIDGLNINRPSEDYIGLFGATGTGAVISNVGLTNVSIKGKNQVGGLVGDIEYGNVTNCYVTGSVTGVENVGGMAGQINWGTITNAYTNVTTSGNFRVGGFVGLILVGTLTNAYSIGVPYDITLPPPPHLGRLPPNHAMD